MTNQQTPYSSGTSGGAYQPSYNSPTPALGGSQPKNLSIIAIVSLALAIIGILIGILNLIQINQATSDLNSIRSDLGFTEDEATAIDNALACTLPSSSSDIQYLNISDKKGDEEYYITPTIIEPYVYGATDEETISTDATDIIQYVFSNGLSDFSDYEVNDEDDSGYGFTNKWSWSAEIISSTGSSCLAKGNDTPPDWFTSTINMINDKINQFTNQ